MPLSAGQAPVPVVGGDVSELGTTTTQAVAVRAAPLAVTGTSESWPRVLPSGVPATDWSNWEVAAKRCRRSTRTCRPAAAPTSGFTPSSMLNQGWVGVTNDVWLMTVRAGTAARVGAGLEWDLDRVVAPAPCPGNRSAVATASAQRAALAQRDDTGRG